ncbi:UNKNOWN [Stylonychia lemnae]|uniref:Uncharacterized protein n=1 Tax=Stylonychia lemnae TaxID=5949 RepID=A0A077ZQA5_STYLE|nr:UNKNOWN [Stylonychia lemnae]|eukprot:CDW71639.1 UNKNOWN [Stylonychia lemnae]
MSHEGLFGRDLFQDGPFFNQNRFSESAGGIVNPGVGHFVSQSYVSQTKFDNNGRPIQEKYQNRVAGALGNGNRIIERQQMYDNGGTGLQKISHERMLNDQGRKIVKERVNDQMNSYDYFKNITEDQTPEFDHKWEDTSKKLGFITSTSNNRLGYGSSAENTGLYKRMRETPLNAISYDDNKRGVYVNDYLRDENMQVNMNRENNQRSFDQAHTQPFNRSGNYNNRQIQLNNTPLGLQNFQPLALTEGSNQTTVNQRLQANSRPLNNNNFNNTLMQKGPARAY